MMYDKNVEFGVNGVFHRPDYYCIWTKGRNDTSINKTVTHELCHILVDEKYNHYCIDYRK